MYKSSFKKRKTIIIMNEKYQIKYSNIDHRTVYTYIQKFDFHENLHLNLPIQYYLKRYYISAEKFIIGRQFYYIIAISPKEYKCEDCRELSIDIATGLYNRNYLESIRQKLYNIKLKNSSLILIDIDNLKYINDNYGHLEGDKAIEIVGKSIKRSIGKKDIGVRYGGDEFLVILFNESGNLANRIVCMIRKEINKRSKENNVDVDISIGVAESDCLNDLDDMIKTADKKLYEEKKKKKDDNTLEVNNLENLRKDIEEIRHKLNIKVLKRGKDKSNQEILELSMELDELIVMYIKNIQER